MVAGYARRFELAYRAGKVLRHYRNPAALLAARLAGRRRLTVTDRLTGLTFECRSGAERMVGEVFHARLYDVSLVPVRPGDVVLDIGANHGFYSTMAAAAGAHVVAFEPDPDTLPLLRRNTVRNGLGDRVRVVPEAVGGAAGTTDLFQSDLLGGGMSSIVPTFAAATQDGEGRRVRVEVAAFVDLLDRFAVQRVRVCKLDCEGSELDILRSITPGVLERIDAFALEYHPEAYPLAELVDVLDGWEGFQIHKVRSSDMDNHVLHVTRRAAVLDWSRGR